jgi:hypothetical protein
LLPYVWSSFVNSRDLEIENGPNLMISDGCMLGVNKGSFVYEELEANHKTMLGIWANYIIGE